MLIISFSQRCSHLGLDSPSSPRLLETQAAHPSAQTDLIFVPPSQGSGKVSAACQQTLAGSGYKEEEAWSRAGESSSVAPTQGSDLTPPPLAWYLPPQTVPWPVGNLRKCSRCVCHSWSAVLRWAWTSTWRRQYELGGNSERYPQTFHFDLLTSPRILHWAPRHSLCLPVWHLAKSRSAISSLGFHQNPPKHLQQHSFTDIVVLHIYTSLGSLSRLTLL